jgi:hypothetical protein
MRVSFGRIAFAVARIGFGEYAGVARVAGWDSGDYATELTGTGYEGCCSQFDRNFGRCMVWNPGLDTMRKTHCSDGRCSLRYSHYWMASIWIGGLVAEDKCLRSQTVDSVAVGGRWPPWNQTLSCQVGCFSLKSHWPRVRQHGASLLGVFVSF